MTPARAPARQKLDALRARCRDKPRQPDPRRPIAGLWHEDACEQSCQHPGPRKRCRTAERLWFVCNTAWHNAKQSRPLAHPLVCSLASSFPIYGRALTSCLGLCQCRDVPAEFVKFLERQSRDLKAVSSGAEKGGTAIVPEKYDGVRFEPWRSFPTTLRL